ncbi:MAG: sensor histidine kinase, partial [Agromyces sp.]
MTRTTTPVRLSLRSRLLIGMLALLAGASAIVGISSVAILHGSLVARIDQQLTSALGRGQGGFDDDRGPNRFGDDADPVLRVPGQSVGTVAALLENGRVVSAAVISDQGRVLVLTATQAGALATLGTDGEIRTIDIPGLGDYRALAAGSSGGSSVAIAIPLASAQATSAQLAWTITGVAILALGIAAALGSWVIRRSLRPLTHVTETAMRVSELPLERGEVALPAVVLDDDDRTEVGQLGAAFNRMLGHVARSLDARELSERKVRQFVADASHELRTPLASIRGYAELTRMSPEHLPQDAEHALGRIEAESVRMTELVEDLLLLARLDEGRELELREVALGPLLEQVVADARAAGPDHSFSLVEPDGDLQIPADESRIRQVFVNLLANARVHTPPGTNVLVSVQPTDDAVIVNVHDDGPGIDPSVADTLF